jgi:RNA polymerase sigma-70 factor, ECF subfamily
MPGERLAGLELLRAFSLGDGAAAEELYRAYAPRIYGLGMVMLGAPEQAEDLVQDTFVRMWRDADRYDAARGSLDTWVLLMARSMAIDRIRRRVVEARVTAAQEDPGSALTPGPEGEVEILDLAERARRAMAALSPEQRAALELAYFGGRTTAEIAEIEGIPLGTAKTRIRSALIRLRDVLEVEHEM